MRKKFLFPIFVFCLAAPLLASASPVAGLAGKATSSTVGNIVSSTINKAVKGAISHCAIIESKIQSKMTDFDNVKLKHLTVYDNLSARLDKIADRLEASGADVAALRADLAVLDEKIVKFTADYAVYVEKLKASQEFVCGRASSQFKTQLKETKIALQQVHKDAADIRNYFVSTIRVEIMKLRDIIKPNATTTPARATSTKDIRAKATSTKATSSAPVKPRVKPITPALPDLD